MKTKLFTIFLAFCLGNVIAQQEVKLDATTNGTTVNTCNAKFYDDGGPNADYSLITGGTDYTITFCKGTASGTLQAKFDEFDVFWGNKYTTDTLFVYDGPNTSSPIKHFFSNFNKDEILEDNLISTSGCLTFRFKTSPVYDVPIQPRAGWKASIICCNLTATHSVTNNTSCSAPDGTATIDVVNGVEPFTYLWSPSAQNQTTKTATGLAGGTYYVLVTDALRCVQSFSDIVVAGTNDLVLSVEGLTDNNTCKGGESNCSYDGPLVVINEIMVMPGTTYSSTGQTGDNIDASIQAMYNTGNSGQEWVELYNPSPCDPIDLSCYVLGANTLSTSYCAFSFPPNTVIPPLGFLVVGGSNAPNVNIKLYDYVGTQYLAGSTRWHLANGTGYLAMYNPSGGLVDGVYWGQNAGVINTASEFNKTLALPSAAACSYQVNPIPAPNTMASSFLYVGDCSSSSVGQNTIGKTVYRETDGSNTWIVGGVGIVKNTPGVCNGACAPPWTGGNDGCNGAAKIVATNGTGAYTYIWSHAPSQNVSEFTNLCKGEYTVSVSSGGCNNSIKFTIKDKVKLELIMEKVDALCSGKGSATVKIKEGTGTGPYEYKWSNDAITATISNLDAATYTVTVKDVTDSCFAEGSVTISASSPLTLTTENTLDSCSKKVGTVKAIPTSGTAQFTYLWNDAAAQKTQVAKGLSAGTYDVTVTDFYGCTATATATVTSTPAVTVTAGSDSPVCIGKTLNLSASSNEGINFVWNGPLSFSSNEQNPVIENVTKEMSGVYTVKVASSDNLCEASAQVPVIVKVCDTSKLIVPNVFTPDGDGKNEEFKAEYKAIESFNCIILNRWGKKVYEWDDISKGWNGKTNGGTDASDGVYYYIITAKGTDEVDYKMHGTITLIR